MPNTHATLPRTRGGPARRLAMLLSLSALAFGLPLAVADAVPASAARLDGMLEFDGFHVGAFTGSDGEPVFCLEPGVETPLSDQLVPRRVEELRGYSVWVSDGWGWSGQVTSSPARGEQLRQMNWVLSEHGAAADPGNAASVQIALWELRREPGNADWLDAKLELIAQHGGGSYIESGRALAALARTEARAPSEDDPSAMLEISRGDVHGRGTVSYPKGTTRVTLAGARFDTGAAELRFPGGAEQAGSAPWSAELHDNAWARYHEVRAAGEWETSETFWPAAVILHPPTRESEQLLGTGAGPAVDHRHGAFDEVSIRIDSRFAPTVTTAVPERFVARGSGLFSDALVVGEAPGVPWPRKTSDGSLLPLRAHGVLYGPFASPQHPADHPPVSTPVAARMTTAIDRGPGRYEVQSSVTAREAGYYYWVWEVREAAQTEAVRASQLLEPGSVYADRFGVEEEGQVVATSLEWETKLSEPRVTLDDRMLTDAIRVRLRDGAWLRDGAGDRIPARIRLTVYGSDREPVRAPEPSPDAQELGSVSVEISKPDAWIEAPAFEIPFERRGWVTVQACLLAADQAPGSQEFFEEWCDDFGVPEETARIELPAVRTEATPRAAVGEQIRDRAYVSGPVPKAARIGFTYYLSPVPGEQKYTEEWRPVLDSDGRASRWSAEEIAAMDPGERCTAQPVAVLPEVTLPGEGALYSEPVIARSAGTGYWVERVTVPHPVTGEETEIHLGECGLPNERTIVLEPGDPRLADTGASEMLPMLGIAGMVLGSLGIAVGGILRIRRQWRPRLRQ